MVGCGISIVSFLMIFGLAGSVNVQAQGAESLNLLPFGCLVKTSSCDNDLASACNSVFVFFSS
ncbi:MAG: hypothetical protein HC932_04355, partial [Thermales bacterium]|nr:hypothetical protein [Thermales bacterium]